MPDVIFPPRPRGKLNPKDLPYYNSQGIWCAQRKFNGSRNLIHVKKTGELSLLSRHGESHRKFVLGGSFRDEILSALRLQPGVEYWLDSELMNKQVNATNEIVLYDVLQAGKYLFGSPDQLTRLEILKDICGNPTTLEPGGIALKVTSRLWMAETFMDEFVARYQESLENPKLEGLLLRKRKAALDNFGTAEYETGSMIRCRKPFGNEKGYNF